MIDFHSTCRNCGGTQTKSGYEFHSPDPVIQVASTYGHRITVPEILSGRIFVVTLNSTHLVVRAKARKGDEPPSGWSASGLRGWWSLYLPVGEFDLDYVRHVIYRSDNGIGEPDGFYVRLKNGQWSPRSQTSVQYVLQSMGYSREEAQIIIGQLHLISWVRVRDPFAGEYPRDRTWNLNAPQLAYQPVEGEHLHWNAIFDHVGARLTSYIPTALRAAGIDTGGKYLRAWFACILRDPACRLPYLFLHGDENSGKSMLWEAFAILVTCGVVKADRAVCSDFNGELEGAILGVIEEREISRFDGVLERIKDAVTGLTLSIRRMRTDTYTVPNHSHWIQCSNTRSACLIPQGDTRFVAIQVNPLKSEIPKPDLIERLKAEAPAILHTMLTMELPTPDGRLRLPIIETPEKLRIQDEHVPALANRIVDNLHETVKDETTGEESFVRSEWTGTAKQFCEQFSGKTDNIAKVRNALEGVKQFLTRNNVTVAFPKERTNGGKTVTLTRAA